MLCHFACQSTDGGTVKQDRYNDGTSKIHQPAAQSDTMKITPDRRSSGQKEGEKKGNGQRESDPLRHEDSAEIVSQYFEEEIQAADEMVKHTEYQLESLKVQDLKKQKDDPPTVVLYFDDPNQSIETRIKDVFPPISPQSAKT